MWTLIAGPLVGAVLWTGSLVYRCDQGTCAPVPPARWVVAARDMTSAACELRATAGTARAAQAAMALLARAQQERQTDPAEVTTETVDLWWCLPAGRHPEEQP